jgi:hypothetical protein
MTLVVSVYVRDSSGSIDFIEPDSPSEELAGFESYRQTLYGSQVAVSLGFKLLPRLATEDLYAEGSDLEQLRDEAELAIANIGLFEAESGASAEHLRARFENIICAVQRASRIGGGVVIG